MEIPAGLLNGLGVVGVVVLMALFVIRGTLVPRSTYLEKVREAEERRKESQAKDQQIAELIGQNTKLADVGTAMTAILRAIERGPVDRGHDR